MVLSDFFKFQSHLPTTKREGTTTTGPPYRRLIPQSSSRESGGSDGTHFSDLDIHLRLLVLQAGVTENNTTMFAKWKLPVKEFTFGGQKVARYWS